MTKKLKSLSLLTVLALICSVSLFTGCSKKTEAAETKAAEPAVAVEEGISPQLAAIKKAGVLRVGSSGDAPFAYINQDTGSFDGVDAEIIKEVAKRLGITKVEMSLIPFSELILNINSGNIDIICDCMYVREQRAKKVYFGDIWYTQGGAIIVPEDSTINGQDTLDASSNKVGYTTGTVWNTIVQGWADDGIIKEAVATGDQSESIVALQYGKIDAFLTDSTVAESLFANNPDAVKGLKLATDYKDSPDTLGRIAPAVSFENIPLMKEINDVVYQLREEGFIDEVFKKYGLKPEFHMITNSEEDRLCGVNSREE
ncbi:MAG: ABC transporter substrate-binding protein [Spirochaetales bacterium]|nr:ABC transporter substrate-binding protein [Spirochaetales bacterium]